MYSFSFERLDAYVEARKLVVETYNLIDLLPTTEKFELASQLQRSITSVPSNIAEGSGRISKREKVHFLEIAYGSLMEAWCQLEICRDLGYLSETHLLAIKPQFFTVGRLITALRKYFAA